MSISTSSRPRWQVRQRESNDIVEHLCAIRSIRPEELSPDFERHLHDPFLLPDMEKACRIFSEVVRAKKHVTIFGDYDADGTPAAALLSLSFDRLGVPHTVVLPTRETGYGLRLEDVEQAAKHSDVLVTVDTGITSTKEVLRAKELGLQVIILDHHLPAAEIPPADAVVDPFVPTSKYPFPHICGCAVAYKFIQALSKEFPDSLTESFRKWLLDIVAISTVADMMVMRDENRTLVHYGLIVLQKNRRVGLKALLEVAGIEPKNVDASSIGYAIGPRFNAGGRLGDNRIVYDLLRTEDPREALKLARTIERFNKERQDLVNELYLLVERELFLQNDPSDKFFVVSGESWPTGLLGLTAGKICQQHNRPVVVLSYSDEQYSGSGRSGDNYSLIDGLTSQASLLERFGGHRTAAGLALKKENYTKFVGAIKEHANQQLSEQDLLASFSADAILQSDEVTLETARRIKQLEPFGLQNPQPLFIIQNVQIEPLKKLGRKQNHIKTIGRIGEVSFDIIGFNMINTHELFGDVPVIDCLGSLEENVWNNRRSLQVRLVDYHPAGKEIIEFHGKK
jgi:single-stranded-DNA-specific exonuclease